MVRTHAVSTWGTLGLLLALILVLLTACNAPGESTVNNKSAPVAATTPIVYTIYDKGGHGGLGAVHANDGTPMWKDQLGNFNWPPVLAGGVIYGLVEVLPFGRDLVAVRASDGKLLWKVPNWTDVTYIAADASLVVVATQANGLYGLDPATGAQRWRIDGPNSEGLLVRDGIVYATIMTQETQPPDGLQYPMNIILEAVRASDGKELWQRSFGFWGSPIIANNHTVFGTDGDNVVAFDASNGHPQAGFPLISAENPDGSHSVKGETVLAATAKAVLVSSGKVGSEHIHALSAEDGHLLWDTPVEFSAEAEFPTTVRLTDDFIIGADQSQVLTAVRLSDGSVAWHLSLFGDHDVGTIGETQGVVFATLNGAHPEDTPCFQDCTTAIVAVDLATGAIYWKQDIQDGYNIVPEG